MLDAILGLRLFRYVSVKHLDERVEGSAIPGSFTLLYFTSFTSPGSDNENRAPSLNIYLLSCSPTKTCASTCI